ncbi:HAD hydrolase-like protein [Actinosynnema sp. NPDC047251]|uniref:Haloacid dehalogenase domain protein hydrolase n=1 Tax=Saccharothrix espanaensis (strain ATCC 51144 / DSM 44229 / JCM 9112 / NBRC 15066 / NRRL 15764) TaxID=1179773 RepID=K0JUD2_SACES|nr:HAD hydrolase-like protein [Saccharothrix espanaensis]CCH27853.1 Haloacid dehalogenase domain protein hydrolase [Saccharothrix espanaensis DSM 44229]
MPLTVGFDLDMTLIDPRPGMAAVMDAVAAECGYPLDGAHFAANLGPPLDMVYRDRGVPEEEIPELVARFRALYPEIVIPATVALPGAAQSLAAVRELGGSTLVVTGKYRANAALHLAAFDWEVDQLFGELWSTGKAEALKSAGAAVYVGDHVGDMRGALAADAVAVGVVTGPCSREELADEGADVVLASLEEFPAWLRENAPRLADGSCARR